MNKDKNHRGDADAAGAQARANAFALIARQPVYGPAMTVMAYELLYNESAIAARTTLADAREGTLRIITDAALEIGLDRLAGGLPVHINYPRELLASESPPSVHPERVVIEVLEDVPSDPQLIRGISALRARGHRIALDDYSPRLNSPALLDVADIVKIDVSQNTPGELAPLVRELKRRGLTPIAEEVETIEQFEHCIEIGFEGFQGNFLQHPQTFRAQRVPSNRLGTLRLVSALQNADCSIDEIERLVSQDVSISYRVLRCINSSYYNLPRRVDSIRQAIVILGLENLRQLCTLAAMQDLGPRPPSVFLTAMTRARMCEQLGRLAGVTDTGPYFITGLFSMLDVLTGIQMSEVVDELPLTASISRALIGGEGELGAALRCARAYERASWEAVAYANVAPSLIRAAYVDSVFWAEEIRTLISK